MRLLNTKTGLFFWIDNPDDAKYAVLSHVWGRDGEQSYQDLVRIQHEASRRGESDEGSVLHAASPKIRNACAHALADGFEYIWIDFCCIDKTSSAEVSQAVLAMYSWYGHAAVCYAYLDDVEADEDPRLPDAKFRRSRWHTRGWTLPELIAPKTVIFLSVEWRELGTKHELADVLEAVTGVDKGVLIHDVALDAISVARRMSWAAKRLTARKEDEAYALLGLFGVHMPIMYGEGADAFLRLQEEILKVTGDQSLFVWDTNTSDSALDAELHDETRHTLLASSPAAFVRSAGVQVIPWMDLAGPQKSARPDSELPIFDFTPHGVRTSLPVLSVGPQIRLALLPCVEDGHRLALVLKRAGDVTAHTVGITEWEVARARYRASLRTFPWHTDPAYVDGLPVALSKDALTRVVKLDRPWPKTMPTSDLYIAHRPFSALTVRTPAGHSERSVHLHARERRDDLIRVERTDSSLRGFMWACLAVALDAAATSLVVALLITVAIFLLVSLLLLLTWMTGTHLHLA